MNRCLMTSFASLALATGACTTVDTETNAGSASAAMVETIRGNVAFRERIALPPGARMEIVVTDITNGADRELVLSRQEMTIGQASPPIPFAIDVSKLNLTDGLLYGLRAFIKQPDGTVMFLTSSPFLLNLKSESADIGTVMLTMTSPDDRGAQGIVGIHDGEWRVSQFNNDVAPAPTAPTMTFGLDGRLFGSTGCNSFSSNYTLEGNAIELAPMAVTQRACEAPLMEQERRFLQVVNTVNRVSLDDDGRLVLEGSSGLRIVAERDR